MALAERGRPGLPLRPGPRGAASGVDACGLLAGGPPALALRSGATLLPVFTGREGASGWVTVIEPPLCAPLSDTRDQAVSRLLLQYTALLESYVIRWPDQFRPRSVRFEPD